MLGINKKQGALVIFIGVLFTLLSMVQAQLKIQVTKSANNAVPIVVFPSQGQGSVNIAEIVNNDLSRSGRFIVAQGGDVPQNVSSVNEVTPELWQQRGINYLVNTFITGNRVTVEVGDAFSKKGLLKREFTLGGSGERAWRKVAHQVADAVYEVIMGVPGSFDTRVAYVSRTGRNFQLIVADADGAFPQTILDSKEPILSPAWSPDGRKLAYASLEGKRSQIIVQDLYSGQRHVALNMAGINSAPSWSPDGSRLVFTLSKDGNPEIYSANVNGGGLTRLTSNPAIDTEPVWGRDGAIYFTSDREGNPQVYRMSASGGNAARVTYDGSYNASPSISEDGKWLTTMQRSNSGFGIAIMNAQTGAMIKRLTNGGKDESPSFSSNGHMIIYSDGRGGLNAVSSDGNVSQRFSGAGSDLRSPSWSPRSR